MVDPACSARNLIFSRLASVSPKAVPAFESFGKTEAATLRIRLRTFNPLPRIAPNSPYLSEKEAEKNDVFGHRPV